MRTRLFGGKVSVVALLALLPGCCFTQALWADEDEDGVPAEELVVVRSETFELPCAWQLVPSKAGEPRLAVNSVTGPDRDGVSAWQLVPTSPEDVAAADVALALLGAQDAATKPELRIEVTRDREQGDLTFSEARLVLVPKFVPGEVGQLVDPATLPAAVRERLAAAASAPQYTLDRDAASPLLARCEQRLRELDLRRLLPSSSSAPLVFVTASFVDDAWQPWTPAATAVPANPRNSADPASLANSGSPANGGAPAPLVSDLAQLEPVRAVVLATDGVTQHTFVLRMARAWSWAELAPGDAGQAEHVSYWAFRTAAAPTPAPTVAAAAVEPFPLRITEREIAWQEVSAPIGTKLALTPLTLLGDFAAGWVMSLLELDVCLCDDDDDDESAERRKQRRDRKRRR